MYFIRHHMPPSVVISTSRAALISMATSYNNIYLEQVYL